MLVRVKWKYFLCTWQRILSKYQVSFLLPLNGWCKRRNWRWVGEDMKFVLGLLTPKGWYAAGRQIKGLALNTVLAWTWIFWNHQCSLFTRLGYVRDLTVTMGKGGNVSLVSLHITREAELAFPSSLLCFHWDSLPVPALLNFLQFLGWPLPVFVLTLSFHPCYSLCFENLLSPTPHQANPCCPSGLSFFFFLF